MAAAASTSQRPAAAPIMAAELSNRQAAASSPGQASRFAFVTLVTSDAYLSGAIVLAHSLRSAHSLTGNPAGTLTPADIENLGAAGLSRRAHTHDSLRESKRVDLLCFVTPATVSIQTIRVLLRHYDRVVGVEPLSFGSLASAQFQLASNDAVQASSAEARGAAKDVVAETRQKLKLLGRPDLGGQAGAPLTKLHAWRLTGYDKVIYLDADTLVLRPMAHLFSISAALAASPDIGWPDSFNSGLLVLTPSLETFGALREYAVNKGSWDGADQGLLNDFYGGELGSADIGPGGGWQRLPFRYNVTPNAGYTFAPAYQRYGGGIMMAHFIGQQKPWIQPKPTSRASTSTTTDFGTLLSRWYSHLDHCYPRLAETLNVGRAQVIHTQRGVEVVERPGPSSLHEAIWEIEDAEQNRRGTASKRKAARPLSFRGAGQVEDLKSIFRPDIVAASATAELEAQSLRAAADGNAEEGQYLTLPLDGRTSLMALKLADDELDSEPSSAATSRDSTPQQQTVALAERQEGEQGDGTWSPPKLSWDPAKEPPPVNADQADYQMRNSVDTYFDNAWDLPASARPKGKQAFFEAAKQAEASRQRTLSQLQKEHFFDNLGSDQPDASKVKAVFPWENASRQPAQSSRIFPDEEPSSVKPGSQTLTASHTAASGHAPERRFSDSGEDSPYQPNAGQAGFLSSGGARAGLPASLIYPNAWDRMEFSKRRQPPPESLSSSGHVSSASSNTRADKTARSSQTPQVRYRNRSAQAEGVTMAWQGSNIGPGLESPADQSGDGDNESSSSSEEEYIDAKGATRRREGPGPGYQRKAETLHHASGTSPRISRHDKTPSLGSSPTSIRTITGYPAPSGQAASTRFSPVDMSFPTSGLSERDTRPGDSRSRASSYMSDYMTAASTPSARSASSRQGGSRRGGALDSDNAAFDSMYTSTSETFYDAQEASMLMRGSSPPIPRRTHRNYLRSPHGSLPGSAANSSASSPSASATPTNLSPSQSRADLYQMSRIGSAGGHGGSSRRSGARRG